MLPSEATTVGIGLCAPLKYDVLAKIGGVDCGCAFGAMLVGYANSWADAVAIILPVTQEAPLTDATVLIDLLDLKGAAKNKVLAIAPAWAQERECPTGDGEVHAAAEMMAHLNDTHDWPREQVRDWLASVGL
jgi:hypothetical protein